ncbi:hypothetical protein C8A05DRAFT_44560 [Staphylotrichum tortipilum]|uniref:Flavin-containing monooxygenase n=1 Tax=Staphylotrichum tortipilum TaxID=2831512 RepID=A0AAN6MJ70_9PEZI|nr:hypothetical protein C8A05DRAFT_44560 [Staphylotrichum longicolle]
MSVLHSLPCALPTGALPADAAANADNISEAFASKLSTLSPDSLAKDAIWRDMFAVTGSLRTFYGAEACLAQWRHFHPKAATGSFKYRSSSAKVVAVGPAATWLECSYTFQAEAKPKRDCLAIVSLVYDGEKGEWVVWMVRTVLDQLSGHPNVDHYMPDTTANLPKEDQTQTRFECVVIGGGQAGLSVAGRLAALGVSYVLLEKNKAVGDNWRHRYKSTKLHTTRESSHLPFDRTFPESYPEYLTKNDLATGYSEWAKKFNINIWLDTSLQSGGWLADSQSWQLDIVREGKNQQVMATHLVMAVGAGCQIPVMPQYPDKSRFRGTILHSGEYVSADAWQGKKGIVVGTANTAHDVAEDMLSAGLSSVTMVQRSPTYVLPAEYYARMLNRIYTPTIPTLISDLGASTTPLGIARLVNRTVLNGMAAQDPERFERLAAAGFKVIRDGDIVYQLFEKFGGHYMDVGASGKIAAGFIKIKSDAGIARYSEDGLVLEDDSKIEADVIIYATGFVGNMRNSVRDLFGDEVAGRVEDFWGIDAEGEIKGAFKPSGHPHLWLHGGTCGQARFFSRFIAMQIRAELDGTPLFNAQE